MTLRNLLICSAALGLLAGCSPEPTAPGGMRLDVAARRRPWQLGDAGGEVILTRHYELFTTSASPAILSQLPGFLEASYRRYHRLLQLPVEKLDRRMRVYMFAFRTEWVEATKQIVRGRSQTKVLSIGAGGYYNPYFEGGAGVYWNVGGAGAYALAAHEGMHQFLDRRMDHSLPMWLEEGLATVTEGFYFRDGKVFFTPDTNPIRFEALRRTLISRRWVPLQRLLAMDAGDAVGGHPGRARGYYAQVWVLARMLRESPQYAPRLARLTADADAGRFHEALGTDPEAFRRLQRLPKLHNQRLGPLLFAHYISDDLDAFEAEYRAFAAEVAGLPELAAEAEDARAFSRYDRSAAEQ